MGSAATAPLNEVGYQAVALDGTSDKMMAFAQRVAKAKGLKVQNQGSLAGFVKFYSGEVSKSSLWRMNQEMDQIEKQQDSWLKRDAPVLSGLSATLDSAGFEALQNEGKDSQEMTMFIRRVIEAHHLHIVDEGSLQGFAQFYSSQTAGGYTHMVQELGDISKQNGAWLHSGDLEVTGLKATLDEAGFDALQKGASKETVEMAVYIRRLAEARSSGVADSVALLQFAKDYSGEASALPYVHLLTELDQLKQQPVSWMKGLGLD